MTRAACFVMATAGLLAQAASADEMYYRKDASGALVLTNVPSSTDLRAYRGHGPLRVTSSGEEYRELIARTALSHGIHPDLVFAVAAVESNFDSRAVSEKGAQGLMQLMPDTAARFGVADAFNPAQNVLGGVRYMRYLLDLFKGDSRLALAAYNAGENVVLSRGGVPPYPETRRYVSKVLQLFGGKKPIISREPPRPPASRPTAAPIKTYTDAAGVVHMTDSEPPKSTPSPTAPPPDATP
ncbi:MAG TPA: lytic transglycosylase domain-containing protein [Candidatus Polarisedimenticolia bacterium]|nr:lytic transglycosylase domain-containing protein [Candidatus Polarisedimenticolia bacterium]